MPKIRNINGTSDLQCKCDSWLGHWIKHGGRKVPDLCPVRGCNHKPTVGAHIQKESLTDKNWYIIPLCHEHNMSKWDLDIYEGVYFASANQGETCGRPSVLLRVQR